MNVKQFIKRERQLNSLIRASIKKGIEDTMKQQTDLTKYLFVKAAEVLLGHNAKAVLPSFETCLLDDGIIFTVFVDSVNPGLPEDMIYTLSSDSKSIDPRYRY